MEETEIPGETHLDVQYEDVSNTYKQCEGGVVLWQIQFFSYCSGKTLSCMSNLNGSELRA